MFTKEYSRIRTRIDSRGDVSTETVNQPSGLVVEIDSGRFGKEGTSVTLGFDTAPNRNLRLDGRQARTLFNALQKHYANIG